MANNQCGECTFCCTIMGVDEINKPAGDPCAYCAEGKGCNVYAERPASCRTFECVWLSANLPANLRPDRSKVVLSLTEDGDVIFANIDKYNPDAHKRPEMAAFLKRRVNAGKIVMIDRQRA